MPTLHFVDGAGQLIAVVEAQPGDLLLDVARLADVPLHWRCGQGTCGTCKVAIRHAGPERAVSLSRKERNVLLRAGLIDAAQAAQEIWADVSAGWRLACHVPVAEQDWQVVCPQD
ncbi:2Fe-2S iron-sulfur cluster-binding protein [Aquitalea sp. LB_tupeE]|uniref:2Fe-2S iron-sulfur cluster-binding protein n=1 Tax=Aquitalea sp. LB_tupeE TaxID=2748078 RepID=UPI0015BE6870|nr:2Fe-2S iron-sulfur cluster-binding protein [Aquitalea sp. LB_tupeE]NWK79928.1 (2Fe-2S)-binding protein [Aquitalea sp. LB_tupeE]